LKHRFVLWHPPQVPSINTPRRAHAHISCTFFCAPACPTLSELGFSFFVSFLWFFDGERENRRFFWFSLPVGEVSRPRPRKGEFPLGREGARATWAWTCWAGPSRGRVCWTLRTSWVSWRISIGFFFKTSSVFDRQRFWKKKEREGYVGTAWSSFQVSSLSVMKWWKAALPGHLLSQFLSLIQPIFHKTEKDSRPDWVREKISQLFLKKLLCSQLCRNHKVFDLMQWDRTRQPLNENKTVFFVCFGLRYTRWPTATLACERQMSLATQKYFCPFEKIEWVLKFSRSPRWGVGEL